jgi:hypothetical protein
MARTLCKKSKIGTFADFLDLHLADSIPRVLPEIETAILVISNSLAASQSRVQVWQCSRSKFDFGDALDQEFDFGKNSLSLSTALNHSLMLSITLLLSTEREFKFGDKISISAMTLWNLEFDISRNTDNARCQIPILAKCPCASFLKRRTNRYKL